MKRLTRGVVFLAGVAGIYAMLLFGLHRAMDVYGEQFGCGCGRLGFPAVLSMIAVSDFFTYKWWIAYPLLVAALLSLRLWLGTRKRLAAQKLLPGEVEPRINVWTPSPKA